MNLQGQFSFEAATTEDGYGIWTAARKKAAEDLARRLGLPLGHRVEVWLRGNVRLEGRLHLKEDQLFIEEDQLRHLELTVDRASFTVREMDSCVRLD